MLTAVLGSVFAFFLVVVVHEWGHFIVARLCGIKVLRFSIGFGTPIFLHRAKSGVEYAIGWLPLGGYVRMQDAFTEEENTNKGSSGVAFEKKSVWARMCVVLAGPFANFVLAIILFSTIYVLGVTQLKPIVGDVAPNGIFAKAGVKPQDQLISIGHWKTASWEQVMMALIMHVGDRQPLPIVVSHHGSTIETQHALNLAHWKMDPLKPDLLMDLGLTPYFPPIPPVIAHIAPESPASKTQLRVGDQILSANGEKIKNWQAMMRWIVAHPNQSAVLKVLRHNAIQKIAVTVGVHEVNGVQTGYLGLEPKAIVIPKALQHVEQYSWLTAVGPASLLTMRWVEFHLVVLKQIVLGKISLKALSGPVSIFQAAGSASAEGVMTFLQFVAFISVVLGVFNLLPIPVLDGGHFMFCLVECIIRRPVPMQIQRLLINSGALLLLLLMVYATLNDLLRLAQ